MKNIYFRTVSATVLFLIMCQNVLAAGTDDFVIKIRTDLPGTSTNNEFTIQTLGSGYNYNVDCNDDGTDEATSQTGDYVCSYANPGSYFIRIQDKNGDGTGFPRIYYNNTGDHRKLLDVFQWGTGKWSSMGFAFRGAINMTVSATDVPDLSTVTNLASMFRFASLANPDTSNWDVSNVSNMHSMFRSATAANPDTSNWITTNVTTMAEMFRNATSANPDVSGWNISNVSNMSLMFANVTLPTVDYDAMLIHFANQNVMNTVVFDGGNSQYCNIAAQNARASLIANKTWTITDGNQCANSDPLNDFVFTVVTNNSGSTTDATFTIPTNGSGYKYSVDCNNDGTLEVAGVTTSYTCDYSALGGAGTYTIRIKDALGDKTGFPRIDFTTTTEGEEIIDISQWGTGLWTTMENAFRQTSNLQISATDAPDLSQVTSLQNMFRLSLSLTAVGANWDTSTIENMNNLFSLAGLAQPQTSSWDTSNVTSMISMFDEASSAQPDTSNWNTAKVKFMQGMFRNASSANPDTSNWDIQLVSDMTQMFFGVTLPTSDYDAMLSGFNNQTLQSGVVFDGGNSKYCDVTAHDGLTQNHSWVISDGGLDPSCPATPADDFIITVQTDISGATNPLQFTIPTAGTGYNYNVDCDDDNPGTNTATAQSGDYTCNYAVAGTYTIRISDNIGDKTGFPSFNSNNYNDAKKIVDLKQWGTGIWSTMVAAFSGTSNMIVTATDRPDLSVASSLTNMFDNASLANPDTSNWDVSNISSMIGTFRHAISATPDVSNWVVDNVNNMGSMFAGAISANPNVSHWNTSQVTSFSFMFFDASSANPDVSSWNTAQVQTMIGMFSGATAAIPDLSSWDVSAITAPNTMQGMLDGLTLPTGLYDAILANFDGQVTASDIVFSGGNSMYCNITAHDSLINKGWTITDGGLDPNCPTSTDGFIITVQTDISGTTNPLQFIIPANGSDYNYNVDCDTDNPYTNTASAQTGDYTCNYANPGTYTIRILDNAGDKTGYPRFYPINDSKKIVELKQWGTGLWSSMENAFRGTSNMTVSATDIPNLSLVTNAIGMFFEASLANPNTSNWDVSNIQQMNFMFFSASSANPNVSQWNTSNVTSLSNMFNGATSATPDMSTWDISGITTPSSMDGLLTGITLPTTLYDATLANFNDQITANGIEFNAGFSQYCNIAARDSLVNKGWFITDGGLDPNCVNNDIIFSNGFEEIVVFNAAQKQFEFDFSKIVLADFEKQELLIAIGLDNQQKSVIRIYLRNDREQLQIRMDTLYPQDKEQTRENNQWVIGRWQSINNTELTSISW